MDTTELKQLNSDGLTDIDSKELFLKKQNGVKEEEGSSDTEGGETGWLSSEKVDLEQDRGVWSNKMEFFLAIMGYTIGIGSVWRFPIICRYSVVILFLCLVILLFKMKLNRIMSTCLCVCFVTAKRITFMLCGQNR
jgi:hypothetical protein